MLNNSTKIFKFTKNLLKCKHVFIQTQKLSSTRTMEGPGKKVGTMGWLLLSVPITTFGLGCWQVQRKEWKENLLKDLDERTKAEPIKLPENLDDLHSMEYRPIKVRGKFLHDKEIVMGPRSYIENGDAASTSGLFSQNSKGIGYNIITPFKIEGREETILINRGWVPKLQINPTTRQSGQVPGTIDVIGVVRLEEKRAQFSPENRGNNFYYRDLGKMCSLTGSDPYFIDARFESTIPGGPIGGQTRATMRNDHLSYLITWFSLSAFSSLIWYTKVIKKG